MAMKAKPYTDQFSYFILTITLWGAGITPFDRRSQQGSERWHNSPLAHGKLEWNPCHCPLLSLRGV